MTTADDVLSALQKSWYPDREWAFLPQVANATGGRYGRTADAVALNCWPSRGMELHGFEVKVYRGDWKRELEAPEKAEAIAQYCDRWFLVIPDEKVIKPEELPPTWGLYVVTDGKPALVKPAVKLDAKPLTRGFIAAVLRAAQREGGIPLSEHQRLMNAHWDAGVATGKRSAMSTRDDQRVRWQVDALIELERRAEAALKSIRRELGDFKKLQTEPSFTDDDATLEASQSVDAVPK